MSDPKFSGNLVVMRLSVLMLAFAVCARAEVYTMTLSEAVDRALAQNPELMIARVEEQKAAQAVRIAKDPFYPKIYAGSGLAYSSGFPLSLEGSAPSIVQAKAIGT